MPAREPNGEPTRKNVKGPRAMTTPPTPTPAPAAGATPTPRVGARLRNGELRRQVAEFLAARAGNEFTPGEVARGLPGGPRSAGAVRNALAVLADRGEAEQTSTKTLRYRVTPTTTTASAAPSPGRPAHTPRTSPPPAASPTPAPSAPVQPAATAVVSGPVTRPNGQLYHPRQLSGLPDVTALRKLRQAGVAALLYGPPGTGKTSVVEAAFPDLVTVSGDGDTTVADLVGEYTQTPEGRYVFVHGPLVTAMREGRTLFIDDATLIPPTVLAVVYPAMDGRRQIIIKANGGEVITAAEGFYVVAGHNPGVHGAVLTDALSSRFSAQIQVSTDYDLATQLKIDRRAVRVARNLATRHQAGEVGWAPQLRELIAFEKIATVLGPMAAASNLVGTAPEPDRATVAAVVRDTFGAAVAPLALGARIV
jgi:nitric oxide reductase NorQ protein